jgi:hypothetical protein
MTTPNCASLGVVFVVFVMVLVSFFVTRGCDFGVLLVDRVSFGVWFFSFRALVRDSIFVSLFVVYVIAQFGVVINGSIVFYYYEYCLLLWFDEVIQVFGVFVGCWSLSILLWVLVLRCWGKKCLVFGGVLLFGCRDEHLQ